jgi:hypothetical protein
MKSYFISSALLSSELISATWFVESPQVMRTIVEKGYFLPFDSTFSFAEATKSTF